MKNFSINVTQYKKASQDLEKYGYYRRGRAYKTREGNPCHYDLWIMKDGEPYMLAYNITKRRCDALIKAYLNNTLKDVPDYVLQNYVTNGYNTRRGLFADYSKKEQRMRDISFSHAEVIGGYNHEEEHKQRVRIRNKR